ncbi:MAG: hypothetical protein COU47_04200 [Candidatus Niyogibacteria bacterium CG10_big_fil_rev_8_21_14_0_10_46_36]|uniref:Uncharacterized protein n=1 Tax=Candidatus Niyogibacteria bacterium CG10_big_fil_rev_8_21_14_0_10_46_36 TaxID=1974726 RepID=A0A2H0TCK5_9BACT|nr:MAG: hypothetical protein COU47_04200 [Candidatus Niyogibacteria bacterium CG10_big_fil_rev_8_21_14_0_10_46_36]
MINLLPEKAKHHLAQERFVRFVVVSGIIIALIACIAILLLWIPWVTLALQEDELEEQLNIVRQSPLLMHVEEIEDSLSSLNGKLDAYERNSSDILLTSRIIEAVLSHVGSGVSLSFFSYTFPQGLGAVPQFRIEGVARDRSTLLALSDALDGDAMIENVRSPISNFLEESNIEFTLTFNVVESLLRSPDVE